MWLLNVLAVPLGADSDMYPQYSDGKLPVTCFPILTLFRPWPWCAIFWFDLLVLLVSHGLVREMGEGAAISNIINNLRGGDDERQGCSCHSFTLDSKIVSIVSLFSRLVALLHLAASDKARVCVYPPFPRHSLWYLFTPISLSHPSLSA